MADKSFDPREFLSVAAHLAQVGDEASLRTAVGRAYYASFLLARDKTGITIGRDLHRQVIDALGLLPGCEDTAELLESLRRLRVRADYQLLPTKPKQRNWSKNWQVAYILAQQIIPQLT